MTSAEENRRILEALQRQSDAIEERFGAPLTWDATEGRKRCWVTATFSGGYADDPTEWRGVHEDMVDAMLRLEAAVSPYLDSAVASARSVET